MKLLKMLRSQAGTTLVELIISTSLLGMVLGVSYLTLDTGMKSFNITSQTARTFDIARRANNEMTDKIKRAELPLIEAGSDTVSFSIDLIPETGTPANEMLMYEYLGNSATGTALNIVQKTIWSSTGTVVSRTTVATNVINRLVFNYYDTTHTLVDMPQNHSDPNYRTLIKKIKTVRLTSRVQVEDIKGRPKNVNLESEVELRNAP